MSGIIPGAGVMRDRTRQSPWLQRAHRKTGLEKDQILNSLPPNRGPLKKGANSCVLDTSYLGLGHFSSFSQSLCELGIVIPILKERDTRLRDIQ